ncbi:PREDICTED: uncharacterized protein LOC107174100 isoform X2 [Diuraphis noxia]|uniref:uncharacterized protein LOC107174100 isoform X2 n=1 Tax=Diuraphis noxia TaxID=143948 RepID=UPI000763985B|nr:PREDICTED: uncharacterized protein LOC107174100 isoform X2 [Diuraphis noxia]
MESIDHVQESSIQEEERDPTRTALEVQLQNHEGEDENSPEDSSEEEKPLSAAARRVRFYKTAKQQQNERQTLARAMSAPSSRQQSVNPTQGLYSGSSRRKSQDVHRFPTRKLKSCRSKAFHKSIDVDSRLPIAQKFGKKNQNVEVVTMMSLLSPVGSDVEESPTPDDVSTKTVTFPQFNNSMRYHQKSFDSAMTSIGKPKLLNNRVGKSLIKSRTVDMTRDDDEDDGTVVKEVVISNRDSDDDEEMLRDKEITQIDVRCDVLDGQPMLKSDKEKECWALFKKMTAKGVSVTFDTVLRFGLCRILFEKEC